MEEDVVGIGQGQDHEKRLPLGLGLRSGIPDEGNCAFLSINHTSHILLFIL